LLHPIALVVPQDIGTLCQAKGPASWDRAIQCWYCEIRGGEAFSVHWASRHCFY